MDSQFSIFTIRNWQISFEDGITFIMNKQDLFVSSKDYIHKITLPFSLNELINNYVSFGLLPSLFHFNQFKKSSACLIQSTNVTNQIQILPQHIINFNNFLTLEIKSKKSYCIPSFSIHVAVIFINSIDISNSCMYITTLNDEYFTEPLIMAKYQPPSTTNKLHVIHGPAFKLNNQSYNLFFSHHELPEFFKIINVQVTPNKCEDDQFHIPNEITPKNISIDRFITRDLYRVTFNTTEVNKPKELHLRMEISLSERPDCLVFLHYPQLIHTPLDGNIFPVYTASDKIIPPQESIQIKVKSIFNQSSDIQGLLAFFLTSANTLSDFYVEPLVWYPKTPLIVNLYNPTSRQIQIKRGHLVAALLPCICERTTSNVDISNDKKIFFCSKTSTLNWDNLRLTAKSGKLIRIQCHLAPKDLSPEEHMIF